MRITGCTLIETAITSQGCSAYPRQSPRLLYKIPDQPAGTPCGTIRYPTRGRGHPGTPVMESGGCTRDIPIAPAIPCLRQILERDRGQEKWSGKD